MAKLVALLCRWFCYVFSSLPIKMQLFVGDLLGVLWYDILRIRRKILHENIALAFPDLSFKQVKRLARGSCCNLGRNFVEFTRFPFFDPEKNKSDFIIEGLEHLLAAKEKGRGVCALTLHLGNGDMGAAGMALNGLPFVVISKEFKLKWLNELWFKVRSRIGTEFISPRNSSFAILKGLKKKKIVGFVLDQYMGPPIGVKVKFFGVETGAAMGLAVIAHRSGAPVVPTHHYRRSDGKTAICFEKEIPFIETGNYDESIAAMTQVYTDHIEACVRKYPQQWMWVHRRWKKFGQ